MNTMRFSPGQKPRGKPARRPDQNWTKSSKKKSRGRPGEGPLINLVAWDVVDPEQVEIARSFNMRKTKAKPTTWWVNLGEKQQAKADQIIEDLRKVGVDAKSRVINGTPVSVKRARPKAVTKPTAPDPKPNPRDRMIAAYRELEWQRQQQEFAAAAPQHKSTPLPTPKTPELRKRQARSVSEEITLRLLREGKIPS